MELVKAGSGRNCWASACRPSSFRSLLLARKCQQIARKLERTMIHMRNHYTELKENQGAVSWIRFILHLTLNWFHRWISTPCRQLFKGQFTVQRCSVVSTTATFLANSLHVIFKFWVVFIWPWQLVCMLASSTCWHVELARMNMITARTLYSRFFFLSNIIILTPPKKDKQVLWTLSY